MASPAAAALPLVFCSSIAAFVCSSSSACVHNGEPQPELSSALQAYVVLNLTADLRSSFTWNTKQLFVFVNVVFETPKNSRNQIIMWSSIIEGRVGTVLGSTTSPTSTCCFHPVQTMLRMQDQAFLRLPMFRPQYPYAITDQGFNLRGRQFNVTVAWDVMPRVGALRTYQREFSGAQF